jgi:hypothetical protein
MLTGARVARSITLLMVTALLVQGCDGAPSPTESVPGLDRYSAQPAHRFTVTGPRQWDLASPADLRTLINRFRVMSEMAADQNSEPLRQTIAELTQRLREVTASGPAASGDSGIMADPGDDDSDTPLATTYTNLSWDPEQNAITDVTITCNEEVPVTATTDSERQWSDGSHSWGFGDLGPGKTCKPGDPPKTVEQEETWSAEDSGGDGPDTDWEDGVQWCRVRVTYDLETREIVSYVVLYCW